MAFSWFGFRRNKTSNAKSNSGKDLVKKLAFKPRMEVLEDRLTPTAGVSVLQFHIVAAGNPNATPATFNFGGTDLITTEPTSGTSQLTVEVDRTTDPGDTVALSTTVSATYTTTDETATAGTNYTATTGTITIPGGQTSATSTVPILNVAPLQDGSLQGNKVFGIGLSDPSVGATINPQADSTAVTIKDSSGTQNQRYVNDVFFELLNRPADPGALQAFGGELAAGTAKGVVLLQIETAVNAAGRNEYNDNTVNNLFQQFLGRNADLGALNFYGSELSSGAGIQQLEAQIIGSDEYFANAGGTNTAFISAMYRDLLNRNPDSGGLAFYTNFINEQTQENPTAPQSTIRATTAANLLGQTETITDQVTLFYTIYLNRQPDNSGLAFYINQLQNGVTLQAVTNEFLASTPEYFNNV